jgi:hypothetical protein
LGGDSHACSRLRDAGDDSKGMSPSQGASRPPNGGWEAVQQTLTSAFGRAAKGLVELLRGRPVELLTAVALAAGALLVVSDFLDLFRIETGGVVIKEETGGASHSYALLVIGIGIAAAALVARSTEQWPPAAGVLVLAVASLAIWLFGDLSEATRSDLVRGGKLGDAEPATGFWVELVAIVLALATGSLLTLLLRRRARDSGPR